MMLKNLFLEIKDIVLDYVKSRLFPLTLFFIILFAVLIHRLFVLQIVEGEEHANNFTYKIERTLDVEASRGNIYDCNGKLLAYNRLSYALAFENAPGLSNIANSMNMSENQLKNQVIYDTLQILHRNGDDIDCSFPIEIDKDGQFVYNASETTKNSFLAEVYLTTIDKLTDKQRTVSAEEVFNYLRNGNNAPKSSSRFFDVDDSYTDEEALQIVAVRYNLWLNRYQQYVGVNIANDISESSMAQIKENSDRLYGMSVDVTSVREYNDPEYFAGIIGYIGSISSDELAAYNETLPKEEQYSPGDMIGKTGLEQKLESYLRYQKGSQKIYVDNMGRVLEVVESKTAVSGNDVYLTLDSELTKFCYDQLEKELAAILLANMTSTKSHKNNDGDVVIPIYDFYNALFANNVISIDDMQEEDATELEHRLYDTISRESTEKKDKLVDMLLNETTAYKYLSKEKKDYIDFTYDLLRAKKIIDVNVIDDDEETVKSYLSGDISFQEYLKYLINQGAVDITSWDIDAEYYTSDEIYKNLIAYVDELLTDNPDFDKVVIEYMVYSGKLSMRDIAFCLYDQEVLDKDSDKDYKALNNRSISTYEFMRRKVQKLEITPAMLALDPCSGSVVITDVNSGEVRVMVSYPGYDNNRLTNSIEYDYYNKLLSDKTSPFLNRPTQTKTAPGSTFKIISTIAGLSEGVLQEGSSEKCTGTFDKSGIIARCHRKKGHGIVSIKTAIQESCNVFFYEVGYKLATKDGNGYNDDAGLERIKKYASMFGLNETSGIELDEYSPHISDMDSVRSAIGQGTHAYTPTQISRYVTTVANSGTLYELSLVKQIEDIDGNVVYENPHKVENTLDIPENYWDIVHGGMRQMVQFHVSSDKLINQIKVKVAGKTGTAQEDLTRGAHALFISYAPYKNPEVSVTVVIPNGYTSANAVEVAGFIYAYMYDPDKLEKFSVTGDDSIRD